ncbi:hypothetical protein IL306_004154, partial [Fusarium sp. DS 682]
MANGSAQLRGAVSELLEEDKQPSEIADLLKNNERADDKMDEADSSRLSSTLNDRIVGDVANDTSHSFPVDNFESLSAGNSSMKQEESSPDSDSCIAMESTARHHYTENPSTISTANFTSPEMFIDYTQPNTPHTHANFTTKLGSPEDEKLQDAEFRMYPNYDNNFGNLALSNSIRANGYPRHIQDAQVRNIFVPSWAATTLNTEQDPGDMSNAFGDIYQKTTSLLKKGELVDRVIGRHPNIAA